MEPVNEARHEKVLDEIVSDFRTQKNDKEFAKQELEIRSSKLYSRRKWFARVSRSILLLSLIYAVAVIAIEVRLIQNRPYFAYGVRTGEEYRLNPCVSKMWKIRKAIDGYYSSYRRYPKTMHELEESGFLAGKLICPASGEKYFIKKLKRGSVFECAVPSMHGVNKIWAYIAGGPPVVEHDSLETGEQFVK